LSEAVLADAACVTSCRAIYCGMMQNKNLSRENDPARMIHCAMPPTKKARHLPGSVASLMMAWSLS
jgi:hypothetical protein